MWSLTPADIAQAKQAVSRLRTELLARQARELGALEAEHKEVDQLDRWVDEFFGKFVNSAPARRDKTAPALQTPEPEPAPAPAPAVAATPPEPPREVEAKPAPAPTSERAATRGRNQAQRNYTGSNFDTFRRALSRNL